MDKHPEINSVEAFRKYAETIGTVKLSDEEKRTALFNAVLEELLKKYDII